MQIIYQGGKIWDIVIEPQDALEDIAAYSHMTAKELVDAVHDLVNSEKKTREVSEDA